MINRLKKILVILCLCINVIFCIIILLLSAKIKGCEVSNETYIANTVALEESIAENTQFALDYSRWDFEPFLQLCELHSIRFTSYHGIIIPLHPCQFCREKVLQILEDNIRSDNVQYVIFLPEYLQKDFNARYHGNKSIKLIYYNENNFQNIDFIIDDDIVIFHHVDGNLKNYFKANILDGDYLHMII